MVATETTTSGAKGASRAASSAPAVSAKATPRSTQMSRAMLQSAATGTRGSSTRWEPTVVR